MVQSLNNREIALAFWVGFLIVFLIFNRSTRKSVGGLLKKIFASKLFFIFLFATGYVAAIVYFLFKLNLWDTTLLKTTVLWLLTAGYIYIFKATDKKKNNYFIDAVKEILKFTIIIEFVADSYTFSLFIELLLIPLVILLSGTIAVGRTKVQHAPVVRLLNNILSLLGIMIIGYAIYKIITDFNSFASRGTLNEFLLPPTLSLLYLPFVYGLSLLLVIEESFIVLERSLKTNQLIRYAKWQAIRNFPFNKKDVRRWTQLLLIKHAKDRSDIRTLIQFLKRQKRIEKNPPEVPENKGWSPYKAKDFLIGEGIITGYYGPIYGNEWGASSPYFEIKDSDLSSNIAYYVEGDGEGIVADRLKLVLNVYSPVGAKIAHGKFIDFVTTLCKVALNQTPPPIIINAILKGKEVHTKFENKLVSVLKSNWIGHKFNGYNLEFVIRVN